MEKQIKRFEYNSPNFVNLSFSKFSHGGGCNPGGAPNDCGGGDTPTDINDCSRGTSEATNQCFPGNVAGSNCDDGGVAVGSCIADGTSVT
ncbi:hypothetical protein A2291_08590 [candidate division WOR-1 bacterium RIFOXYB2_FULL_42_35]|uniref:Uncharacterized protein n=1 Tax=candidate division WOR-1 bacterium RIFOXYC2_FULL_41_25 TaxID=1802586 RepID=A0A1F4TM11_UNCSA|nr:MAG: hypothetical protein A2291_08590 [candidate division WOR-1 bacterium RIFOXYB2_FULL_42_35]OGC23065.1 MAG: hypothetical protein A2247_08490 [candidate division WOR-1 bacterium RIFOXYA2_FULL_41_14]OGC33637.1 MAG: hypothetical protein A2462_02180 [candidate division WOR-1 bacterium RIFOXYC2_FULL_41_25]OGC43600.1 MAG: hypothetical protein A2548_02265 [candidate division WOR-1 bacterium RIFOXYD2_FULL_41_8]